MKFSFHHFHLSLQQILYYLLMPAPSFIDIEEETLGLNPNLIEEKKSSSTKAIYSNGLWWYVM